MQDFYEDRCQWLQERLLSYDKSVKKRIEQTYKNFNSTIRGHIRTETALRLGTSIEEGTASIPIRVVDGFPHFFKFIIQELDPQFWELFLKKSLLKTTSHGLDFLDEKVFELARLIEPDGDYNFGFMPDEIEPIKIFVDQVIQITDQKGILQRLKSLESLINIESEVLGAYYFKVPEIHLYWGAIALVAIELEVSVEALTIVALTHELVHAYTHLGQDTDNDRWDTDAFANTHNIIVEGLAQFYTEVICTKLKSRQPDVLETFLKLLDYQSPPYTEYRHWVNKETGRAEIIRSAMIECRKNQICDLGRFMEAIEIAQFRIGKFY